MKVQYDAEKTKNQFHNLIVPIFVAFSNSIKITSSQLRISAKGAVRLVAKQREVKVGDHLRQPSRVVAYVTREGSQPSQVVAKLREWSLHRLILSRWEFASKPRKRPTHS